MNAEDFCTAFAFSQVGKSERSDFLDCIITEKLPARGELSVRLGRTVASTAPVLWLYSI